MDKCHSVYVISKHGAFPWNEDCKRRNNMINKGVFILSTICIIFLMILPGCRCTPFIHTNPQPGGSGPENHQPGGPIPQTPQPGGPQPGIPAPGGSSTPTNAPQSISATNTQESDVSIGVLITTNPLSLVTTTLTIQNKLSGCLYKLISWDWNTYNEVTLSTEYLDSYKEPTVDIIVGTYDISMLMCGGGDILWENQAIYSDTTLSTDTAIIYGP